MNAHNSAASPAVPTTPSAPSFLTAAMRIFDLSLGQMLWSRRSVFLVLVVGAPLALGLLFRVLATFGAGPRVDHTLMSGATIFGGMIWILYLRFIVPVLGVFYGTALIADEVDDKTVTYLFVRPISRGAVLLGKYLAYLVITVLVVLPSVVLLYLLVVPMGNGSLAGAFPALLADLGLLALGLAGYGAIFSFIGAWLKHPLVTGLVFAFGWEQLALVLPGYVRRLTVAFYLQGLVPHAMPTDGLGLMQSLLGNAASTATSVTWLLGYTIVFVYLACRAVARREYVLEQ